MNTYKKLFTKINTQSNDFTNEDIDLNKYMYNYDSNELGIPENYLSYVTTPLDKNNTLNGNNSLRFDKDSAISDVNFLFNLLKYSYAGYSYFGGDATFENAKEKIIESINSYTTTQITSAQLENILTINTTFIQDGHFSINNKSPLKHYSYYSNENICLNKSRKGYYITENNKKIVC